MKKSKVFPEREVVLHKVEEPMAVYHTSAVYSSIDDKGVFSIIDSINRGISLASFENIIKKYSISLQNLADFLHISNNFIKLHKLLSISNIGLRFEAFGKVVDIK